MLGLQGRFWQEESFDYMERNDEEFQRIQTYIEENPVQANLVQRRRAGEPAAA